MQGPSDRLGEAMDNSSIPDLTVISPVFNEVELIREFVTRVCRVVESLAGRPTYEVILVDDGSSDGTAELLRSLKTEFPHLRVLSLTKNFGQSAALQAGFDHCRSPTVVSLDSDLQHAPEEIPLLLQALSTGFDCVCSWRQKRQDGVLRRLPSRIANIFLAKISGIALHDFGSTFRAYRGEVARSLQLQRGYHRFIPALLYRKGFRITEIPICSYPREAGRSSSSIYRVFEVAPALLTLWFRWRLPKLPIGMALVLVFFSCVLLFLGVLLSDGILRIVLTVATAAAIALLCLLYASIRDVHSPAESELYVLKHELRVEFEASGPESVLPS